MGRGGVNDGGPTLCPAFGQLIQGEGDWGVSKIGLCTLYAKGGGHSNPSIRNLPSILIVNKL